MHIAFTPLLHPARPAVPLAALALLTSLALVAAPARAEDPAARVQLSFVHAEDYADIGRGSFDREQNLRTLSEHFQRLGRGLPAGQRLQIEVLDVDLAGEIQPRFPYELRVLRGGVDWPRMTLRYTLKDGETTLAQGEDRLSDASYLFTRRPALEHQPLPFERRMLEAWFTERFAGQVAAATR